MTHIVTIEKIAEQVREKKLEGISHVQDESDRVGVRVVIELKRDATAEVVLNQLFRFTPMQTYFGCNMLALNGGRPEQLTLRSFLTNFIAFREDVVARRTAFELRKARERSCDHEPRFVPCRAAALTGNAAMHSHWQQLYECADWVEERCRPTSGNFDSEALTKCFPTFAAG